MSYHSLGALVTDFDFNNQEIWKILVKDDSVWFQSFTVLFLYTGDKVQTVPSPGIITAFFNTGGRIYARITDRGLYRLNGTGFVQVDDSPFFRDQTIRVILPLGKDRLLIATSVDGVYSYRPGEDPQPWHPLQTGIMRDRVINRGIIAPDGRAIFGTQLSGIYIFDTEGNFQFNINQSNGMQNNTILALYTDDQGYLWAGLDNGIDLLDTDSGISFYRDMEGELGAVYSVLLYGNTLFAGTNKGLFYSAVTTEKNTGVARFDFHLMPGSESQVWSLERFGDQVFCGHNDGTYEVQDLHFRQISDASGGYSMKFMNYGNRTFLIQSTYNDLVVYAGEGGRWEYSHRIPGFNQPAEYIEADHLGNIWAGHKTRGLCRVELTPDLKAIRKTTWYGAVNGFLSDYRIGVYKINNRVVFLNEGNLFTYDDLHDTILPLAGLNRQICSTIHPHRLVPASGNEYWFISDNNLVLYRIRQDSAARIVSYPFNIFDNKQIKHYENLREIDPAHSILCLDNGFALVSNLGNEGNPPGIMPLIRKVTASGGKRSLNLPVDQSGYPGFPELPHHLNSIQFRFACPVYGTSLHYRIRLDGLDENWTRLENPEYRYDRLPSGEYRFQLVAEDGQSNQTGEIGWNFRIRAPWYWSPASITAYLLAFVALLWMIRRYFVKRLVSQEKKLKAEKESELVKVRNERLQSEISYKSKELANTTFSIIKKNELLMEIREAVEKEVRSVSPGQRESLLQIARLVDRNISNDEDWKVFESNFEQAHEEFLYRIRDTYLNLTPGDLKLCAYLRMNLSTKKIALLLGITVRGVENHRYRLRKKLQLDREANLTEFLMRF
jgi:DNA-binding CsgD family transcriptional regulator